MTAAGESSPLLRRDLQSYIPRHCFELVKSDTSHLQHLSVGDVFEIVVPGESPRMKDLYNA
jgi:hypothetical protein